MFAYTTLLTFILRSPAFFLRQRCDGARLRWEGTGESSARGHGGRLGGLTGRRGVSWSALCVGLLHEAGPLRVTVGVVVPSPVARSEGLISFILTVTEFIVTNDTLVAMLLCGQREGGRREME